jgi:hypothetical protein
MVFLLRCRSSKLAHVEWWNRRAPADRIAVATIRSPKMMLLRSYRLLTNWKKIVVPKSSSGR